MRLYMKTNKTIAYKIQTFNIPRPYLPWHTVSKFIIQKRSQRRA